MASKGALFRAFIAVASRLPLPIGRWLGRRAGDLASLLNSREARITRANIALCFPAKTEREQRQLVRDSLRHWGMTVFEIPIIWRRGVAAIKLIGEIHGEPLLERQLASGSGSILVSPHLGNWELVGLWLSTHGPCTFLYQPPKQQGVEDIVRRARAQGGATLVPTDLRGISALVKALKRGEITGILPDMVPDASSGLPAPFFGVPAHTMTLVHNLRIRTGAGILLIFASRTRQGFDIHVLAPDDDIYSDDPQTAVEALNRLVEKSVLIAPEQYQWEYKRFKGRGEGLPAVYQAK